jgi:integrase
MSPPSVSNDDFAELTSVLLACLAAVGPKHTRATFHLDLEPAPNKRASDPPVRGGTLTPEDEEKGPFNASDPRIQKAWVKLLKSRLAADAPLYLIHYEFERRGERWDYKLTTQSLKEYLLLLKDRLPLDDVIDKELRAAGGDGWERISLRRADVEPTEPLRVTGRYKKNERRVLPASDTLKKAVDDYYALFKDRGLVLFTLSFALEGGPAKTVRDVDAYYGGPR